MGILIADSHGSLQDQDEEPEDCGQLSQVLQNRGKEMTTGMKTLILTLLSNKSRWVCRDLQAAAVGSSDRNQRYRAFLAAMGELSEEGKIITTALGQNARGWMDYTIRRKRKPGRK
jgi:hypothetical protein